MVAQIVLFAIQIIVLYAIYAILWKVAIVGVPTAAVRTAYGIYSIVEKVNEKINPPARRGRIE